MGISLYFNFLLNLLILFEFIHRENEFDVFFWKLTKTEIVGTKTREFFNFDLNKRIRYIKDNDAF